MAQPICETFVYEPSLDGKLVINRTLEGPPLATVADDFDLGGVLLGGAQAVPYVKFGFLTTWTPKEAIIGPARSILGLAPGEELTIDVTTAFQFDYAAAVTNSSEFSVSADRTERSYKEVGSVESSASETTSSDTDTVDLGPIGSWGCGGDADTSTISEIVERTSTSISEILTSVSATQTNGKSVEVSMSSGLQRENTVSRRVVNPYRDRTLELRFHPVFRRFEVATILLSTFKFGLVLKVGEAKFSPRIAMTHADFLDRRLRDRVGLGALQAQVIETAEPEKSTGARVVQAHLQANAGRYTAAYIADVVRSEGRAPLKAMAQNMVSQFKDLSKPRSPGAESAIAFDAMRVEGDRLVLPLRSLQHARKAIRMPGWQLDLADSLSDPQVVDGLRMKLAKTQDVRLFMGTHVEAAAGSCVLPEIAQAQQP